MSCYPYIIAGLPDLLLNHESGTFDYPTVSSEVKSYCDRQDVRTIDWLEAIFSDCGNKRIYSAARRHPSSFIRSYCEFDFNFRSAKVTFLSGESLPEETPDREKLDSIFNIRNLMEREKAIDTYFWEKIDLMVEDDILNMNVILSFLAKARIVDRWSKLDQASGEQFFKQLVGEVRGTFKGVNFDSSK